VTFLRKVMFKRLLCLFRHKPKICPECNGTGITEELDYDAESVSMVFYREINCRKCNGRGYLILREKKINER